MNATVLIIIAVTFALVVGPLFWLRPTPRDRQLERLRGHARRCGMNVSVHVIADPDPRAQDRVSSGGKVLEPKIDVALYALPLRLPGSLESRHAPAWEVIRLRHHARSELEDEMSAGLHSGWRFERPGLPLWESVVTRLSEALEAIPRGSVKVEADDRAIGLYWQERGTEADVDAIADALEQIRLLQLDVAADAARAEALRHRSEAEDSD